MSKCYVISDLHLGHRGILKWRTQFNDVEEHDNHIIEKWNSIVNKRDTVYVLGDVAFDKESLAKLDLMKGKKILIAGNHDDFNIKEYIKYFDNVRGLVKKNNVWLSHAPLHAVGARGCVNIHGHLHTEHIKVMECESITHINVCCENTDYEPVDLTELIEEVHNANEAIELGNNILKNMNCSSTVH